MHCLFICDTIEGMNRKERRMMKKKFNVDIPSSQDSAEPTLQIYWIPLKRKSQAGVEYIYYKKIVDKVGLDKSI